MELETIKSTRRNKLIWCPWTARVCDIQHATPPQSIGTLSPKKLESAVTSSWQWHWTAECILYCRMISLSTLEAADKKLLSSSLRSDEGGPLVWWPTSANLSVWCEKCSVVWLCCRRGVSLFGERLALVGYHMWATIHRHKRAWPCVSALGKLDSRIQDQHRARAAQRSELVHTVRGLCDFTYTLFRLVCRVIHMPMTPASTYIQTPTCALPSCQLHLRVLMA